MKKPLVSLITLLVLTSFCLNCKQDKALSDFEFEQAVFYEIFPALLDSIHYDIRLIAPPPPPPTMIYANGIQVKNDSSRYKRAMSNWKKRKVEILKDTASIYLTVYDSIIQFQPEDMSELMKHFKNQNIVLESQKIEFQKGYKVDLNKLKTNNKKLKFKYQSEFPKGREFWQTDYEYYIAASLGFNRILFDKTKTFGVLNTSYGMGILNGHGYRVFIRKDDSGKWIIDEISGTWIS